MRTISASSARLHPPQLQGSAAGLLSMRGLKLEAAHEILSASRGFRENPSSGGGVAGLMLNLFFEHSTRTRTSFEVAAKRLGLDVVNFDLAASSVSKGESLEDTIRTIDAMRPDFVVVRHPRAGAPEEVARFTRASVINAGDGAREHPTQALLDTLTLCDHFGFEAPARLSGLRIALVGDIAHSRVARSNLMIWKAAGADVRLVGPRAFVPQGFAQLGWQVHHDLESGIRDADVVYCLRVQTERQSGIVYPSVAEYHRRYGLTLGRLDSLAGRAVVMHPGPVNRGVELSGEVLTDPRCLVETQVANGVWTRMAVIKTLHESRKG